MLLALVNKIKKNHVITSIAVFFNDVGCVNMLMQYCIYVLFCAPNLFVVLETVGNELENTLYALFDDGYLVCMKVYLNIVFIHLLHYPRWKLTCVNLENKIKCNNRF